jgi:hypothetical protein
MNAKTAVFGAIVFGLASAALSINDTKLSNEYRWIVVDGPYACPSKEDLHQITNHHTDETSSKWSKSSGPTASLQEP